MSIFGTPESSDDELLQPDKIKAATETIART